MNTDEFWALIDSVRAAVPDGDQNAFLQATKEKLLQFPSREIAAWYKIYTSVVAQADHRELWQACDDCGIYVSDDAFYYFRAWLISQGKDVYSAVLENPRTLLRLISNPEDASFEGFNYVSWRVYSQKACEEHFSKEGLEKYYTAWALENLNVADPSLMLPGETQQEYSRRLFQYHLEDEFDIFTAVEKLSSLDEQVSAAKEKAENLQENGNAQQQTPNQER